MKNLLKSVTLTLSATFFLFNCSVESLDDSETAPLEVSESNIIETTQVNCFNANPKSKLTNNGTVAFNFAVYNENSITVGQSIVVLPGTSSEWIEFPEGFMLFSIESNATGVSDKKVSLEMSNCTELNLVVEANNELSVSSTLLD